MTTNRVVTGAHYGLRDWMAQRVTAVILVVYTLVLGGTLLLTPELNHAAWKSIFAGTFMRVLSLLAVLSLFWHAWIGVRDIYMDYVKPTSIRLTLQVLTIVLLVGYAIWTFTILWSH
jgi:succinate dehydrogenase / fumarate reductase membrane anchor subunit